MIRSLQSAWRTATPSFKRRLIVIYAFLIALNVGGWVAILLASIKYPLLAGLGLTAYGFGLRHAVDPDHIAAIDNTTRKLMQDGKRPVAVGFFFSFGHSTVVLLLSVLLAVSAAVVKQHLPQVQAVGGVVGTSVSGLFLIIIAAINIVVLCDIVATWKRAVNDGMYDDKTLDAYLANRGFFARILRPLLRVVGDSWAMYPIGFLFGLGFDTASEVGLLGLAATTGASGMPIGFILLLPLIFAAGMSLVDTTDGVAMLGAYGWAFLKPIRKLYYNITITSISIVVALLIGGVEMLQVIQQESGAKGAFWDAVRNVPLANFGFYIIAIFLASWLISVVVYRAKNVDDLDAALVARRTAATE
ncbi:MAG: HoxN/HupN/NixA family nickel/cobalt transporter [Vulcanimicrobiaceae bacterium]